MSTSRKRAKKKKAEPVHYATTYEFMGHQVSYVGAYKWQDDPGHSYYRGWFFNSFPSLFVFGSLKEAKRAVDRLRRVYQLTKRARLLKDKKLLKIEQVERTPL